jgi:hypothetical protein
MAVREVRLAAVHSTHPCLDQRGSSRFFHAMTACVARWISCSPSSEMRSPAELNKPARFKA